MSVGRMASSPSELSGLGYCSGLENPDKESKADRFLPEETSGWGFEILVSEGEKDHEVGHICSSEQNINLLHLSGFSKGANLIE